MKSPMCELEAIKRIREIDAMFETSTAWGSWMVTASNERRNLVDALNQNGTLHFEHKWLAQTPTGDKVS